MRRELLETCAEQTATNMAFRPGSFCRMSLMTLASPQVLQPATTGEFLMIGANTANWVLLAARKLNALGKLKRGWDSYGGLPLSSNAKKTTFEALDWLKKEDLPIPAVVLGSGGTVHLEWDHRGKKLELGFGERGMHEYFRMDGAGKSDELEDADLSDDEARQTIENLAEWLQDD